MKNFYKSLMALAVAAGFAGSATAAPELQYGEMLYGSFIPTEAAESSVLSFGMRSTGEFGIAYKLPAEFAGRKVKGLLVPVQDPDVTKDLKAFLSTSLVADGSAGSYTFTPDVVSMDANATEVAEKAYYFQEVRFETPYEIPANGLYMGYSFSITGNSNLEQYPILAYPEPDLMNPERLCLFSKGNGWEDCSTIQGTNISACVLAILDYDVKGSAGAQGEEIVRLDMNSKTFPVTVVNYCNRGVHTFDYTLKVGENNINGTYEVPGWMPLSYMHQFGVPGIADIPVPEGLAIGKYPYTITIDKVNGRENPASDKTASGTINILSKLPTKRPVVEETTCTGCGYCPRGFYGIEMLKKSYPNAIAISYHNQSQALDPMCADLNYPSFGSNPSGRVDRVLNVDDFSERYSAGYIPAWRERLSAYAPADIELETKWIDETQEELELTATVTFAEDISNAKYRIDFAILHDQMSGNSSAWAQTNYYAGQATAFSGPEWEVFGRGTRTVRGLKFNDVCIFIGNRALRGYANSIPKEIKAGEPITFTKTVKLDDLRTLTDRSGTKGACIVQNKAFLKAVAVLINSGTSTFPIENGALSYVPGYNYEVAIDEIGSDAAMRVPVEYYDITGNKVINPNGGIYIVKYSDGTVGKEVIR